jgi:hypothetical protein
VPNAPHGFLVNEVAPLLKGNNRGVLYVADYELRDPADQITARNHTQTPRRTAAGRRGYA